jgi:hypothetical protein
MKLYARDCTPLNHPLLGGDENLAGSSDYMPSKVCASLLLLIVLSSIRFILNCLTPSQIVEGQHLGAAKAFTCVYP